MNNKEKNFISAVVYLNKEEINIYRFLNMVTSILTENFINFEIICVCDAVEDKLIREVHKFKSENEKTIISIIKMGFLHGLEAAMNAGIDLAIGDFVFEFDSCYIDYNSSLIMSMYRKAVEGYDIVFAAPPQNQSKFFSRIFYHIYNHFSNCDEDLRTERFTLISRRALNRASAYNKTVPYRKAVYTSMGFPVYYMDYELSDNLNISGKKNSDETKNATAIDFLILFTNLAYKVSSILSVIMAIFMITAGVYTTIIYFGKIKPVPGWAPIMGLISAGFFATFILLTIIIKYLDILLKLVFKKQKYLVSSIEKL